MSDVPKPIRNAWKRIKQAWESSRIHRQSQPGVWTIFHVGKRTYRCTQTGLNTIEIQFFDSGAFKQEVAGRLPEKIDLHGLQKALDLLEVERVMTA